MDVASYYISEVTMNFDSYDPETLAIQCPECNAAANGRCLTPKPGGMGGMVWMDAPHRSRVLKAHGSPSESIWGE